VIEEDVAGLVRPYNSGRELEWCFSGRYFSHRHDIDCEEGPYYNPSENKEEEEYRQEKNKWGPVNER
jgi:hypothetical protein